MRIFFLLIPSSLAMRLASAVWSPATSTNSGSPAAMKISDLTMLPSGAPTAAAASGAVAVLSASSTTVISRPASCRVCCTRSTNLIAVLPLEFEV